MPHKMCDSASSLVITSLDCYTFEVSEHGNTRLMKAKDIKLEYGSYVYNCILNMEKGETFWIMCFSDNERSNGL